MNKTKFLTSLTALLLTFSLGACSTQGDSEDSADNVEETRLTSPSELMSSISEDYNYSLTFEYDVYLSNEGVSPSNANSGNYDLDALLSDVYLYESYYFDVYYTENAMLFEEYYYTYKEEEWEYAMTMLMVNYPNEDNDSGVESYQYVNYIPSYWYKYGPNEYPWQSYYYSLADAYEVGVQDFMSYGGTGTLYGESVDYYNISNLSAQIWLLACVGYDILNDSSPDGSLSFGGVYFFTELEQMLVNYYQYFWTYFTSNPSVYYVKDVEYFSTIYDVGTTNLDDMIEYVEEQTAGR